MDFQWSGHVFNPTSGDHGTGLSGNLHGTAEPIELYGAISMPAISRTEGLVAEKDVILEHQYLTFPKNQPEVAFRTIL